MAIASKPKRARTHAARKHALRKHPKHPKHRKHSKHRPHGTLPKPRAPKKPPAKPARTPAHDPLPPSTPAAPPAAPPPPSHDPVPSFQKSLAQLQAERLLWRAGFGPRPGDVDRLAQMDVASAVRSLTRPSGAANLVGPAPRDENGHALAPLGTWGHAHCWWLDRMVRSDQQLVERMALVWHDWFATSVDGVGLNLMVDQNQLFRDKGLGSFVDLLEAVTKDPAMLVFLNGIENNRWNPNENYAREVMELFTLGADRGAYSEADVREMARALTGFRADWVNGVGFANFRFDAGYHDQTAKTVFGQTGNFDWRDACRLCVQHPLHASFFVTKLWSYFIPTPPDAATQSALEGLYIQSGHSIRDVLEAILQHPDLYEGPEMVKPPVVFNAGMLRALGRGIDTTAWSWLGYQSGQLLFYPPNVSGWDDTHWLDTSTWHGRFQLANFATWPTTVVPWPADGSPPSYDANETPEAAVVKAMAYWGNPAISTDTRDALVSFSSSCIPSPIASWNASPFRAMRQNALRLLIATSPDHQTS